MRILLLTILFLAPLYFFKRSIENRPEKVDAIGLKVSAPDRAERILTSETPSRKENPSMESTAAEEQEDESLEDTYLWSRL